jgi:hypothetical protein
MKRLLFPLIAIPVLFSCNARDKSNDIPENNIDAARLFIRSALDGRFSEARNYMLADSQNVNYMDVVERSYQKMDQPTKDSYRSASIRIQGVNAINDSVTIVIYSNSFKNNPDTLRVVRINEKWLVDFKYLYQHGMDTANRPVIKDSIP